MNKMLLATDLDGTLVGDDEATRDLNEIVVALKKSKGLKFAYVTGRSPELFAELQQEKSLITPDALVTALGTEIYVNDEKFTDWPHVPDWDVKEMKDRLSKYPSLKLQPATEQRRFKLSYFLEDDNTLVGELREQLKYHPVDVVYSMGLYLDILPRGINKGSALLYLAQKWHIDPAYVYACGDSGNDIDMLENSNAIIVGNAKRELLSWAENHLDCVYISKQKYAKGIIEGLDHYKII